MTYLNKIGTLFTALCAFASVNGCAASEDLEAGDYKVFRVAFANSTPDASCYSNGEIPMSVVEDSTSLRAGGTFIMYATEEGGMYLDTGDMVLAGELDVDVYEFKGKVVDVEFPSGTIIYDSDHDGIDDSEDDFIDTNQNGVEDNLEEFVDVDLDGLDDRFEDSLVDANGDGIDDGIVEIGAGYKFKDTRDYRMDITIVDGVVTGETKTVIKTVCEGTGCPLNYGASCTVNGEFEGVVIDDAQVDVSLGAPTDDAGSSAGASSNSSEG
jgi:hypothetical protein